jgi:hypothetical protein
MDDLPPPRKTIVAPAFKPFYQVLVLDANGCGRFLPISFIELANGGQLRAISAETVAIDCQ